MAELIASKWRAFIDFCRAPALPYQKVEPFREPPHCHKAAEPAPSEVKSAQTSHQVLPHLDLSAVVHPAASSQRPPPETPALLQFGESGDVESSNKRLYAALAAEFLGMLLFALYGGEARDSAAAYGNGLTLAVLVYATANVSGGHLNPAVTLATIISGHMQWKKGLLYMLAQYLGGITGEWVGRLAGGWVGGRASARAGTKQGGSGGLLRKRATCWHLCASTTHARARQGLASACVGQPEWHA